MKEEKQGFCLNYSRFGVKLKLKLSILENIDRTINISNIFI